MNKQVTNNHFDQSGDDRRLELMLEVCRPEPIDNTRIKNLVREKIMREQMVRARRTRRMVYSALSAAACLAILVVLAMKLIVPQQIDLSTASLAEVNEAGYKELIVAPGERVELRLPDGSLLMANARSRVLYPENFEGKERRIFACGEVYLEVAKDREHPFVVESNGFDVRVLGTVFNIRNSSDTTATVVLVEGSVEVTTDRDRTVKLNPDDMVDLVNGDVASLQKVDTDYYTAWTKGLMALNGESLSLLTRRLSDHYGMTISCASELSDVRVYGKLDLNGNLDQVLSTLSEFVPM
ncbi:MAG: FecR domain-containing protein [Muribaculaceae bacterium]|nr:FecR domain-containing protein [Muribaculaceae bacterium]